MTKNKPPTALNMDTSNTAPLMTSGSCVLVVEELLTSEVSLLMVSESVIEAHITVYVSYVEYLLHGLSVT